LGRGSRGAGRADLSEDRSDLESVGRALGYAPSARTGSVRPPLLEDYRRHTEAIRRVYLEVLGRADPDKGG
jgi:hypothetical protein